MAKSRIISIVAALTMLAATSNAGIVIPPSGGSGGSGGGSSQAIVGTHFNQNIDFKRFSMSGHASNWHSDNASFYGNMRLEDGFNYSSFLFADMGQYLYGSPFNERTVYTYIEASFYGHEGLYSGPGSNLVKPTIDYEMGTSINFPGIDISINSNVQSGNGAEQFPNLFMPYLDFSTNLWVNDGTIERMNLEAFWNFKDERLYTRFYLTIGLTGGIDNVITFTDSLPELPIEMYEAFAVPEPATMLLLGAGSLMLRRKRR